MNLKQNIVAQFGRPHGTLGQLAGFVMAKRPSNIERNVWTLDLLDLKPDDHLLEVGFGPGIAIQLASESINEGLIVGVDHSETMLRQASNRNARAIERGLVQLHLGTVETLPVFERPFNKICSANVVQFWRDPIAVYRRLHALLAPGGIIATTYMPRHSGATHADTKAKEMEIISWLEAAGFSSITTEEKQMSPVSVVSVLATNDVV
jgi:ubiquinone/menaquinone biosynthesis C-methylase UbiE